MAPVFRLSEYLEARRDEFDLSHVTPRRRPIPEREALRWMPMNSHLFVMPLIESESSKRVATRRARLCGGKGVVLAVGSSSSDMQHEPRPVEVKIGDLVTYGKGSGEVFNIGGVSLLIFFEYGDQSVRSRRQLSRTHRTPRGPWHRSRALRLSRAAHTL